MVLFTEFAISVLGGLTTNAIISATKNEASKIDTAYDAVSKKTVDWYGKQYGDQYGTRNNRFFDYLVALFFIYLDRSLNIY